MKYRSINKKILLRIVRRDKGVALLVAILTAGIALTIGVGALDIALKQIHLVSFGRESIQAFFTADTGLECALYWDIRHPGYSKSVFATSSDSIIPSPGSNLNCETDITTDLSVAWNSPSAPVTSLAAATTTFTLKFGVVHQPCAIITIAKYQDSGGNVRTSIDSRGVNSCDTANARRVERGIGLAY